MTNRLPSKRHIDDLQTDGFVKVPALLKPEYINAQLNTIEAAVEEQNQNTAPMEERNTYKRAFIQVTNLWRLSKAVREFVFNEELARTAAVLMGVDSVRLYHDQALFKEAGGGHTPWHRDQYYWPMDTVNTITAWIPLVDVPREMGPLAFVPGSHHWQEGRDLAISDDSERFFEKLVKARKAEIKKDTYQVGDVSFHSGWTLHRAEPNYTWNVRAVMTVIYMAADARISPRPTEPQLVDRDAFVPGRQPGEPCDTELNPVLFP
jgi:ectoine hydroxylase-related dioxygenase (phytanoyl-CoA dioxygenase family)